MIKTIIKRDGRVEDFSPEKINGWGVWAAQSLGGYVDWSGVVMTAVAGLPEYCDSEKLQLALIQACLDQADWAHNRMAGRLYTALRRKQLFDGKVPTYRELQERMAEHLGDVVERYDYTDADWEKIEGMIDHDRDFGYAYFQTDHIRRKYSLRDRVAGKEYETPQFTFMRMASSLAHDEPKATRLEHTRKWYDHFSYNRINAPTPNWVNLGTSHRGYASCCLYTTLDTEPSLEVGDHIARAMTAQSAGIGGIIQSRSLSDKVRGGLIEHQGKLPYYTALAGAVKSSLQNGRGGACTTYFSVYDPEIEVLIRLKHPLTPEEKQNLDIDYNVIFNRFFVRQAALNKQVFLFNIKSAPDLWEAQFQGNPELFESLYAKYEADDSFVKKYVSARKLAVNVINVGLETGRLYLFNSDEVNIHTPFNDSIYSSNLCAEITEPTYGYESMPDLYTDGPVGYIEVEVVGAGDTKTTQKLSAPSKVKVQRDGVDRVIAAQELKEGDVITVGQPLEKLTAPGKVTNLTYYDAQTVERIIKLKKEPEVAMCSLAALCVHNIHSQEEYEDAAYYALKMIDKAIHLSDHPLPHVAWSSRQRLSAGVGMTGVAYYMARKKLKFNSPEGMRELHRLAERHMYALIKASLRLGKELGNAPWMHRTKWPQGWMPIDTYNHRIDEYADFPLEQDWESLRAEVIANGGIRHSVVCAHMPVESSSKASGGPNSLYPVRGLDLSKTDRGSALEWVANDDVKLRRHYQLAWDIPMSDMVKVYGIFQKFCDQAISADMWLKLEADASITDRDLLQHMIDMTRYGMKTRYYFNSMTSIVGDDGEVTLVETEKENACTSGACDV